MDQDIRFKTAALGFDKTDVIDYIEALQKENRELKEENQKLREEAENRMRPKVVDVVDEEEPVKVKVRVKRS